MKKRTAYFMQNNSYNYYGHDQMANLNLTEMYNF